MGAGSSGKYMTDNAFIAADLIDVDTQARYANPPNMTYSLL